MCLGIEADFLHDDVDSWQGNAKFIDAAQRVRAINITNDCGERGVKLSSDFLDSARGETHFQNVLQVVEQDRAEQPNLRNTHHSQ